MSVRLFKPGARLVSWNHFDADVGMCVWYVCVFVLGLYVCVSAPQAIRN